MIFEIVTSCLENKIGPSAKLARTRPSVKLAAAGPKGPLLEAQFIILMAAGPKGLLHLYFPYFKYSFFLKAFVLRLVNREQNNLENSKLSFSSIISIYRPNT